ncbi:MAG: twin-arginine translocation pathway signal protein [Comamonadaceae bacterium]|nr:MAG: twin-arginine translocation pathway signal protein [Comamonadaceae bacterium]
MPNPHPSSSSPAPRLTRRRWLQCTGALGALAAPAVWAQGDARPLAVAQIADMAPLHQDVGRDFLTGARAAWQDVNARGGIKGRPVQHLTWETDGTPAALRDAVQAAHANTACVALTGCVADDAAAAIAGLQVNAPSTAPMALMAPWLLRQMADEADTVFRIFPDYQAQIAHALRSLATMGVQRISVVFADAALQRQLQTSIAQAAAGLQLQARTLALPATAGTTANTSASQAELRSPPDAIVLFIGGTPELHDFLRQLQLPGGRQCYVIALADVNLQVLAQMGGVPRGVSVIATQAVPVVTAGLPIVRSYREVLARLYDEPPSPLGLAGFIAARYTAEVLSAIGGPLTRASVLGALRQRTPMQFGGFSVAYQDGKLANTHVTQTMLSANGRIVG